MFIFPTENLEAEPIRQLNQVFIQQSFTKSQSFPFPRVPYLYFLYLNLFHDSWNAFVVEKSP